MANLTITLAVSEINLLRTALDDFKDLLLGEQLPNYDTIGRLEAIKHKLLYLGPGPSKSLTGPAPCGIIQSHSIKTE